MIKKLSTLGKTWILDLDGTIVKHNGYKETGEDIFLPGAREFLNSIQETDCIIFLTSRTATEEQLTRNFLMKNEIRYDHIIFNAPYGERILINDEKPSGLKTAIAINTRRDKFPKMKIEIDETI